MKTVDRLPLLLRNIAALTRDEVLIGVPSGAAPRKQGAMTNASLAYIHEFGSPAANIPARPFLRPGLEAAKPAIIKQMESAAKRATDLQSVAAPGGVGWTLNRVGLIAQNAVRRRISSNIPPPLAASTVAGRLARSKSRMKIYTKTVQPGQTLTQWGAANLTTLIDTGQLRSSITYVVRKRT